MNEEITTQQTAIQQADAALLGYVQEWLSFQQMPVKIKAIQLLELFRRRYPDTRTLAKFPRSEDQMGRALMRLKPQLETTGVVIAKDVCGSIGHHFVFDVSFTELMKAKAELANFQEFLQKKYGRTKPSDEELEQLDALGLKELALRTPGEKQAMIDAYHRR